MANALSFRLVFSTGPATRSSTCLHSAFQPLPPPLRKLTHTPKADGSSAGVYIPDFYGNYRTVASGGRPDSMGLTGKFFDSDADLYFFNARWYDPERGRWMSEDPIRREGGLNLYGFAGNAPFVLTDPTGMVSCAGEGAVFVGTLMGYAAACGMTMGLGCAGGLVVLLGSLDIWIRCETGFSPLNWAANEFINGLNQVYTILMDTIVFNTQSGAGTNMTRGQCSSYCHNLLFSQYMVQSDPGFYTRLRSCMEGCARANSGGC